MKNKFLYGLIIIAVLLIGIIFGSVILNKTLYVFEKITEKDYIGGISDFAIWGYPNINLSGGLVAQYKLNDDANDNVVLDSAGTNNGTLVNGVNNFTSENSVAGKVGTGAFEFDGVDDYVNTGINLNFTGQFSVSSWVKANDFNFQSVVVSQDPINTYKWLHVYGNSETAFKVVSYVRTASGASVTSNSPNLEVGRWYHMVTTYDKSLSSARIKLYIDGSLSASGDGFNENITTSVANAIISSKYNALTSGFNGSIDDVRIYNRSLSESEILTLYNEGAGTEETGSAWVTLNSPTNASTQYVNPVTLNASAEVTGGENLVNSSLYHSVNGGAWTLANTTAKTGTTNTTTFNNTYSAGDSILWNMQFCDSDGDCGFAVNNYTFTIDGVAPTILITNGNGTQNYGNLITNHTVNFTVTDINLDGVWFRYPNLSDYDEIKVFYDGSEYFKHGTGWATVMSWDSFNGESEIYLWRIKSKLRSNNIPGLAEVLMRFLFFYEDGTTSYSDITSTQSYTYVDKMNYNPTPDLNKKITQIYLQLYGSSFYDARAYATNFTFTDRGHSINASSGVENSINFSLTKDLYTATIYANDTAGNLNTTLFNWDYLFFEEGQTFTEQSYETDTELFSINISTGLTILTSAGTLNYDGTDYRTTGNCVNGNCYFNKSLDLSLVTSGESEEKDLYWNLILYDGSTSHNITTETETQNVTRIHLEKCDGTYTTKTLNFTAYRESNLTQINPFRIIGVFETWLGSGSIKRTQSFQNDSTDVLNLCLTPINRTQYTTAQLEYSFDDENITYVPRNYYFQNASLTNVTQDIRLYLLEAEDSTSFIIKVQDQKLSPVVDAMVYIQKYFLSDGTYKTVQISKTDSNGETVGFYEVETTDYKHIIIKNGVVLLETSPQKVVGKDVPYTLTFTIGDVLDTPWSYYVPDPNIQSGLFYNMTTGIVTFSYIDLIGETTEGRLLVVKLSNTNSTNITICDVSSSESSASLTCNVSAYEGNIIAYGYIENEINSLLNFIISTARDIFGREGLMIGMFIIMVSAFAFIWNPSAGIIAINAAVILVNLIGFISVSPIFIFGLIAISIVTIILLKT